MDKEREIRKPGIKIDSMTQEVKQYQDGLKEVLKDGVKSLTNISEQDIVSTVGGASLKKRVARFSIRLGTRYSIATDPQKLDIIMASTLATQAMLLSGQDDERARRILERARLIFSTR